MSYAVRHEADGRTLVLNEREVVALRKLLTLTVGVGTVPMNEHMTEDEMLDCLVVANSISKRY